MPVSKTRKKLKDARYEAGRQEGRAKAYHEMLTYLEEKYVNSTNIKTSAEDQAVLKLARELAELMKGH